MPRHTPPRARPLLAGALALGSAVLVAALLLSAGPPARGAPLPSAPLAEPPVLASHDGVLTATLVARRTLVSAGGRRFLAKTYDGWLVGPTLVAQPGDRVVIRLVNRLTEPTNLHFHGLDVSPAGHADNIFVSVAAGRSFTYAFTIPVGQGSGTYWYHSHADMTSEEQVFSGLSGVLEVEGLAAALAAGRRGLTERVIALRDVQVAGGTVTTHDIDSDAPTTRLVDGQLEPSIAIAPGETQLWHLANIGADIFYGRGVDDREPHRRAAPVPPAHLPAGGRLGQRAAAAVHRLPGRGDPAGPRAGGRPRPLRRDHR